MKSRLIAAVTFLIPLVSLCDAAEVSSPRHEVIAADNGRIVKYDKDGKPVWNYDHGSKVHRLQVLPNGNILTQKNWNSLVEISPAKEIVWSYDNFQNGNAGKKLEVHTFHRLPDGNTAIVENGIGRVIQVNSQGDLLSQFAYQVAKPHPHRDVRQAHWLPNGNVLICQESDGKAVEYQPDGKIA